MSIELGVYQSPELSQQLNLAPQLLQWLRLLQVPTLELSAMVQHELETNPTLEVDDARDSKGEDVPVESYTETPVDNPELGQADVTAKMDMLAELDSEWREDYGKTRSMQKNSVRDEQERHQFIIDSIIADTSLQEHLLKQLAEFDFTDQEQMLAELIIGSLDQRGYLKTALVELAAIASLSQEEAEPVLAQVQEMDPAGVGARDLKECLLLQLKALSVDEHTLPVRIINDYIPFVAEGDYKSVAHFLQVSEDEVHEAVQVISSLNPEPGLAFSKDTVPYVNPDVTIEKRDGEYVIELNDDFIPHLRLSNSCRRMLEERNVSSEDMAYIRRKIRSATFLIQGIGQRQETLKRVVQEILRVQKGFFDTPEGELKPLTMVKVAGILNVHETTVSRAIANKYIRTPRGVFEMKYFFRTGYQCSDGTALTPESVKDIIEELIKTEDDGTPFTDLQIVDLLKEKGLKLARRTVAKYRDELGIPSSKQRGMMNVGVKKMVASA